MTDRAAAAERAVTRRHLRRVWALPGTVLGRSGWPPEFGQRLHWHWNYWWQAHLLDSLIDAQLRAPTPARERLIGNFVTSVRLRNFGRWTNEYYDDIAWLGLALQRLRGFDAALDAISAQLMSGWTDDVGGGIWWRRGDKFKNAPANGPAAIFHARAGHRRREHVLGREWMPATASGRCRELALHVDEHRTRHMGLEIDAPAGVRVGERPAAIDEAVAHL